MKKHFVKLYNMKLILPYQCNYYVPVDGHNKTNDK